MILSWVILPGKAVSQCHRKKHQYGALGDLFLVDFFCLDIGYVCGGIPAFVRDFKFRTL